MKTLTMVLAAAAGLLMAAPAHAQAELVAAQLQAADSVMRGQGLAIDTVQKEDGALAAGASREFRLQLQAGKRYMVVGVCDGGCNDLDLTLTDEGGRTVAEDKALDDVPLLAVNGLDGTFTVKVDMATCSRTECFFGVRVFAGDEQ
jgi:hypothetical protein